MLTIYEVLGAFDARTVLWVKKMYSTLGVAYTNSQDHGKECFYPPPQRRKGKRNNNISPMLERRLEQMEALLQTSKNHSGHFQDPNTYRHMQSSPSPDFRRPSQSVGAYSAHDHIDYRSPDEISILHERHDKIGLHESDRNLPIASVETPRSILCTPPSTTTRPSVGPMSSIPCRNDEPLTPATSRAPIDKEESILSPDNVLYPTRGLLQGLMRHVGELGTPR